MATVQVRYIVNDVDAAIDFYCRHLGFMKTCTPLRPLPCCLEATFVWS